MHIKKAVFSICVAAICYLSVELISFSFYFYMYGKWFSISELHESRNKVISDGEHSSQTMNELQKGEMATESAMHPYLGFVWNKDVNTYLEPNVMAYGLVGEQDPFVAGRDPDNVIVAITGASVAENLYVNSRAIISETLKKLPAFHSKKIVMMMLGRSAWKQPQQFFAVAYYLMQGGRLDLLINIDGKNEATFPYDNLQEGVHPAFPHTVDWLSSIPQNFDNDAVGSVLLWKKLRRVSAKFFGYVDFSVTASTVWSLLDAYLQRREVEEMKNITQLAGKRVPYYKAGPDTMRNQSEDAVFDFSVLLWKQGTRQINHLAKANHFYYFHFLQPNQYVPGSKVLSREEKASAYDSTSDHYHTVIPVYSLLIKQVNTLHDDGINIYDFTGIYQNITDTIYVDSCCHVNQLGNDVMANAIGQRIMEYFQTSIPPATQH